MNHGASLIEPRPFPCQTSAMANPVSLAAYLARIGLMAAPSPDADGLAHLQAAHRNAIAFENLDVRLGRPIRIDGESSFDKLVTRRRGGYCFEPNRLFADMLAALGLPSRPLLARVLLGALPGETPPRTHVLLLLEIGGQPWIADAGFGASYAPPLPLRDGVAVTTPDGATHRLRHGSAPNSWLLDRRTGEDWQPQYMFDLAPVAPADLEQCNHWTSTRADSRFTTAHIVTIATPAGFLTMNDRVLTIWQEGASERREIQDAQDYGATLTGIFGLAITPDEIAALPLFAGAPHSLS